MSVAFVAFVYGESYQDFLPMYAESLFRVYTDSHLLLYTDRDLRPQVKKTLSDVNERHSSRVFIRDGVDSGMPAGGLGSLSPKGRRAYRWLIWDPIFEDYDHLYIGDIDMLMLPEAIDLEVSHSIHAQMMSLPYSNAVRMNLEEGKPSLKLAASMAKTWDLAGVRAALTSVPPRVMRRLTGLHFVRVADYYKAVRPVTEDFKRLLAVRPSYSRDDEELLYDLVLASGLGLPPVSASGPDLDPTHYTDVGFRPHHGIHMGLFRAKRPLMAHAQILRSYVYEDYYASYLELRADPAFRELVARSGSMVGRLFSSLDEVLENGIATE